MFKLKKRWIVSMLVSVVSLCTVISPVWAKLGPEKAPRFEPMKELTTIRISNQMWLPVHPASVDEMIERGQVGQLNRAYAEAVLRKVYNIAIKRIAFRIYGTEPSVMLAALAAGTAPSIIRTSETFGGSVAAAVAKGLAADITPYVGYIQKHLLDLYPFAGYREKWNSAWIDGRCYGLLSYTATPEPLMILYRKDWFKKAGLFGPEGIPGPPDNWTTKDFAEISRKITDPKKERWGFLLAAGNTGAGSEFQGWMDQFGAKMVMPDKTGENTFKAAFELSPMVNLLSFFHDMTFKDKSLLTGVEYESWITDPFFEGKSGMFTTWAGQGGWRAAEDPGTYAPRAFKDVIGLAPLPIGPQGINSGRVIGDCHIINPFQTDEQIEASVKFFIIWNIGGEIAEMRSMDSYWQGRTNKPYNTNSPAYYLESRWEEIPEDYRKVWYKALELPVLPTIDNFGMYIASPKSLEKSLLPAIQMILTNPDADVVTELKKAADIANKSALKFKLKGATTENFKKYYTALGEWYQKNAPEYYKKVFQSNLEKYYKVW